MKLTAEMERVLAIAKRDGSVSAGKGEHAGHVERVSASTILALIKRGLLTHRYSSEGGLAGRLPETPSLAVAARAAGHEPETPEGGIAMMQALTPEHFRRAEEIRAMKKHQPGDEITFTTFTIGGQHEGTAIVTWDYGKRVAARTLGGTRLDLERAKDGSLRRFI